MTCKHPPAKLFCYHTYDLLTKGKDWQVVGCTECGTVLKGSAEEYEEYIHKPNKK